jgi:intracellular septation protein
VAAFYSTEDWVNFKIWGYAIPLSFIIGQGFYIARHLPAEKSET